ncbi:MAG: hypothetical protein E7317_03685 [Clostridiales bacterium]|nr:hypothetical protein [Clostridiales bacterium]
MTRAEHIRALQEEYAAQRRANEQALDRRIEEAEARDPEIARLRAESVSLTGEALRAMMSMPTAEDRRAAAERIKAQGKAHNALIRARLKALGLPEDSFQLKYRCPVCRDTGLVGDAPARFCDCFEARLRHRMTEDGSMADVAQQNFERFDISIFPEEDDQRRNAEKARQTLERYADRFPDTRFRNILLHGKGGLGKTFLLNCVYARVTERGFSAVRVTAFRMYEAMRIKHMDLLDKESAFDLMLTAPLLLIDDLGSEPMMKNITVEYLFLLLNERMAQGRHTLIATNLTPAQLQERYGERVASRLFDHRQWGILPFRGKDLRSL